MTLQYANGSNGFKIWREKSGSRILNASGLTTNGWQKKLTRAGTGFTETDFTDAASIAGRICPTNVFLSHSDMTATDRCLYYDVGNQAQRLDAAHPDNGGAFSNIEGEDWLRDWNRAASGRSAQSSYYEGNIKPVQIRGCDYRLFTKQPRLIRVINTFRQVIQSLLFGRLPKTVFLSLDRTMLSGRGLLPLINTIIILIGLGVARGQIPIRRLVGVWVIVAFIPRQFAVCFQTDCKT
jgi:hypothetical protein